MTIYLLVFVLLKVAFSYVSILGPEELKKQFTGNFDKIIKRWIDNCELV